MDEGAPIAYPLVQKGIPVLSSDGQEVGTVHHVVAAPEQDIFHGLVIDTPAHGRRFVEAAEVASLHERGADLGIDAAAVASLPEPGGGAPAYVEDPAETHWEHWARRLTLRRDWREQD